MKSVTLTPENAGSIAKLAALTGWSPDQLANHLLTETLENFADAGTGALEWFLGAIYYPDGTSAAEENKQKKRGPSFIKPRKKRKRD
jgi:hypothetical protein